MPYNLYINSSNIKLCHQIVIEKRTLFFFSSDPFFSLNAMISFFLNLTVSVSPNFKQLPI